MNVFRSKQTFMDSIAISTFRVMLPIVNFKNSPTSRSRISPFTLAETSYKLLNENF